MSTVANFHCFGCEEAQSLQNTLKLPKFCFDLAKADNLCRDDGVSFPMSVEKRIPNDSFQDLVLSQKVFFIEYF